MRYLRAQGIVLLCGGLVGPIFLIVYFVLGPMARPALNWMYWVGLLVTAIAVLLALGMTNGIAASSARRQRLRREGVLVAARVTGIADTSWFVNGRQMIKVNLRIEVPGFEPFDAQETVSASPARMQILNGCHTLVALVQPGTQEYEIDWDASAVIAGAVPAQFTLDEDGKTYDLTGQVGPLMQILSTLHLNGIALSPTIDIRSNPAVRRQVMDIVRRSGVG